MQFRACLLTLSALALLHPLPAADQKGGVIRLFNGKNLEGFDTFLEKQGENKDPDKVFQVHNGMLHISGAEYGYVITKKEYSNYHLRAEFKWGEATHPPRPGLARDSDRVLVMGPNLAPLDSDHVVVPDANVDRIGAGIFDPLVTLAVAAGATSRVRLGTTVLIVPYRNPVVTAKMVSTLDALSGGRVVLGVGAGWLAEESAALGVPFAERGPMTDEYLAAMRELWTSPAPSFAGKYTQFSGLAVRAQAGAEAASADLGGRPRPRLPAPRRRDRRRLAPDQSLGRELRAGRDELARLCQARGRAVPPAIALRNDLCVLRPGRPAATSVRGGSVLVGEPSALVERIAELGAVGVEHLVIEFLAADGPEFDEQMALFAERVRPKLA